MIDFEAFYEMHVPLVQQVLRRFLQGHQCDLEDLTQDVFTKALKTSEQLEALPNLAAWLNVVTKHVAYDFLRHRRTVQCIECSLTDEAASFIPESRPFPQMSFISEMLDVSEAVALLPVDDRHVLAMLFQEYTQAEIADALGIDMTTCQTRCKRAMRRFRRVYHREDVHDDV